MENDNENRICPDCKNKKHTNNIICYNCYKKYKTFFSAEFNYKRDVFAYSKVIKLLKEYNEKMIEFVNKIESKRGWASMEDVFLDLISFYQIFGPGTNIDAMEPKDQLMFMYQYLKNRKDKLCDADLI